MHHASVNEKGNGGTTSCRHRFIMTSMQAMKLLYDMHKKGFIDMVKGLLAWFIRVLRSSNTSGPTPSISSISSTIVESNHNKQHNKAEIKVLQKYWFEFSRTSLVIRKLTRVVLLELGQWIFLNIWIWWNQGGYGFARSVRNIFLKNEQRHPFNKGWF